MVFSLCELLAFRLVAAADAPLTLKHTSPSSYAHSSLQTPGKKLE